MTKLVPHASNVPAQMRRGFAVGRPIATIDTPDGTVYLSTEHITWFVNRPTGVEIHFAGGSSTNFNIADAGSREALAKLLLMILQGENPLHGALR